MQFYQQSHCKNLEKKYHKKIPVDIEEENKAINSPPDQLEPLEKNFTKIQKSSEEVRVKQGTRIGCHTQAYCMQSPSQDASPTIICE